MKKTIKLILLATAFTAFTANAEETIKLEDNSKILGKWDMILETPALHKKGKKVENSWEFRNNGILAAISSDPRLDAKKEVTVKYSIEDGVIVKQLQPGREKYEKCKVIILDKKDMTLHCKFNYYIFKR